MNLSNFWSYVRRLCRWILLVLTPITIVLTLVGASLFPAYASSHPEVLSPTIAWTVETTLLSLDQLGWPPASLSLLIILPSLAAMLISGILTMVILLRRGDDWFGLFTAFAFFVGLQGGDLLLPLYGMVPGIESWNDI